MGWKFNQEADFYYSNNNKVPLSCNVNHKNKNKNNIFDFIPKSNIKTEQVLNSEAEINSETVLDANVNGNDNITEIERA